MRLPTEHRLNDAEMALTFDHELFSHPHPIIFSCLLWVITSESANMAHKLSKIMKTRTNKFILIIINTLNIVFKY